jgi:hypothetical protein
MKRNRGAFFLVLAAAVFLSCEKTIDPPDDGDSDQSATSAEVSYKFSINEEAGEDLKVFDIKIQYKEANGTPTTKDVTANSFYQTVQVSVLPFGAEMTIIYTPKAQLPPAHESPNGSYYTMSSSYDISYEKDNGGSGSSSNATTGPVKVDKLAAWAATKSLQTHTLEITP